jgi:hypothetical protein
MNMEKMGKVEAAFALSLCLGVVFLLIGYITWHYGILDVSHFFMMGGFILLIVPMAALLLATIIALILKIFE